MTRRNSEFQGRSVRARGPRALWCVVALVLAAVPARARGEEVLPLIDVDTTWTAAGSPYTISGDVEIAAGATLTVTEGVTVELGEGSALVVEGALVAIGTEAAPVVFTGSPGEAGPARWRGIVFSDGAVDASYVELDEYNGGSILEYCLLEGAERALTLESASPYVHACRFERNSVTNFADFKGGAGVLVGPGSAPRIRECTFVENEARGFGYGGAIYVEDAAPIIQDNLFQRNGATYGGALATDGVASPIVGNRFEENSTTTEGGAVSLISTVSAFMDNRVEGNSSDGDGGGVHVCTTCKPHSTPLFWDNVITGNTCASEGAGGIGAAFLRVFRANVLEGNTTNGEPLDFGWFHEVSWGFPEWVANPDLSGNYWGTTDLDAIGALIFDGVDDERYGRVVLADALEAPPESPTPRVAITSRKILYGTADDPMPVTLTLYNPGPARSFELLLMIQYDELPPVPYSGELEIPGAERQGDAVLVSMPERSVYFATIASPSYQTVESIARGAWHAALFDAESGERVGEVSTAWAELALGEEGEDD